MPKSFQCKFVYFDAYLKEVNYNLVKNEWMLNHFSKTPRAVLFEQKAWAVRRLIFNFAIAALTDVGQHEVGEFVEAEGTSSRVHGRRHDRRVRGLVVSRTYLPTYLPTYLWILST